MGTRSLTTIEADGNEFVCMYRQYDGYPTGHGAELAEFLTGPPLVNGIRDKKPQFNGMGCLAAAVVAHFKTEPGNIYLEPPGTRDVGEEYIYKVFSQDGKIWLSVLAGAMTMFGWPGTKEENMNVLFCGLVEDYNGKDIEEIQRKADSPPNDYLIEQAKKDG